MRFEYDFQIAGRPVGVYVLEDDGFELRQLVDFETPGGERYRNEHLVRYQRGRPVAYRVGTSDWVDCSDAPASHWPTAAYPLLLRANVSESLAIDEGTGQVTPRTLEYVVERVVERQDDRVVRTFELRGDDVIRIDWGARSRSFSQAARGSNSGRVVPVRVLRRWPAVPSAGHHDSSRSHPSSTRWTNVKPSPRATRSALSSLSARNHSSASASTSKGCACSQYSKRRPSTT